MNRPRKFARGSALNSHDIRLEPSKARSNTGYFGLAADVGNKAAHGHRPLPPRQRIGPLKSRTS
jgi:hypothetical protein